MRRNELSASGIDYGWPHQIRIPHETCGGKNYDVVHGFCRDEGLSLCLRRHSVSRDAVHYVVFCFAEREHAERFQARFGGEWFNRKAWNDEERAAYMARKGMHKVRGRWVSMSKPASR